MFSIFHYMVENMYFISKLETNKNKKKFKFKDIADEWIIEKKGSVKRSTCSVYEYVLNRYILPIVGEYTLKELESFDINSYVRYLSKTLKPKTVRDVVARFKSIIYLANEKYDAGIHYKKVEMPKILQEPMMVLGNGEKKRLENKCKKIGTAPSIGILLCMYTGMRVGELCALRWENIDLDKGIIKVRKTLQRIYIDEEKRTRVIEDYPKSKSSSRDIPLRDDLCSLLFQMKKENDSKALSEVLGHSSVNITLNRYVHSSYRVQKKYIEKL